MLMINFSAFDWKNYFWKNLVQKTAFSVKTEICCLDYFEYSEFQCDFHFQPVLDLFLGKHFLKHHNCQF